MTNRQIINRKKFEQKVSFEGLQYEKKSPTDIDFCLEIENKILIIGEIKEKGKDVPQGQNLAFKRIVDAWNARPDMITMGFYVVLHHEQNDDADIVAANCKVVSYYYDKTIVDTFNGTLKEFLFFVGKILGVDWLTKLKDKMNG